MRGYPPVRECSSEELHRRLVEDAVAGVATPLRWCVPAYERIAELRGTSADAAYQRVRHDVAQFTGRSGMPML